MTWIPINIVRGEHKIEEQPFIPLEVTSDFLDINDVLRKAQRPVRQLAYETLLGRTIIKLEYYDEKYSIVDAISGEIITPVNRELAGAIAEADFGPDAPIATVTKFDEHTVDYRGPLPIWQIKFADGDNTSLYVSPDQARVVARRSATWRFFDFFWMLHIMDYDEREDINNPLVMSFAALATLFVLSGIGLIYFRFRRRDFSWIPGQRN